MSRSVVQHRQYEEDTAQSNGQQARNLDQSSRKNTADASQYSPGHHGTRRGAIDFGEDGARYGPGHHGARRGAIDFGRGAHAMIAEDFIAFGDFEDFEGFRRVNTATDRDDHRGSRGSRDSERHSVNSRCEEYLGFDHPMSCEEYPPKGEKGYQHKGQPREPLEHPRQGASARLLHGIDVEEEDSETPRLRRAAPLARERAQYVSYQPHGPHCEDVSNSIRRF